MRTIQSILILIIASGLSFAQQSSTRNENTHCPNRWALGLTYQSYLGFPDAPAKIIAIGWSGLGTEKTLQNLELENLSGKTINAVKIKWFIYRVDIVNGVVTPREKSKIVLQGESRSVETGDFRANEKKEIDYWISSCHEIDEALLKDSETEGKPWTEAIVSEILYADGSKWTR